MMKKSFCILMSLFLLITAFGGCSAHKSDKKVSVLDRDGNEIATLYNISDSYEELKDNIYRSFIEMALTEALQCIAEREAIGVTKAKKYLLDNECVICTSLNPDIFKSVNSAYQLQSEDNKLSFGCAVTDVHGEVLALYSGGTYMGKYINYALNKTSPYSAFKPLSVYAPAIESETAYYSSAYEDSPVKKITDTNGVERDWPANATGIYQNENVCLPEAVKKSLNTVAVKVLKSLRVDNSLNFLSQSFGLILDYEQKKAFTEGEDEVLGNVALGYLYTGVSPVDMAGYYQIFANGGSYAKPHSVNKILNGKGDELYNYKNDSKQVIKETTAFIMNCLLQNVVSEGGTGKDAACEEIAVAGKTGTGDDGNWFVGMTPQYVCAVWHGTESDKNVCCEIFAKAISGFENKANIYYPTCTEIKKEVYCTESGMLFSSGCKNADIAYYAADALPPLCNKH